MFEKLYFFGRLGMLALLYLFMIRLAVILARSSTATATKNSEPPNIAHPPKTGQRRLIALRLLQSENMVRQKTGAGETSVKVSDLIPITGDTHLGRAPGNDLRLDDPFASAFHARLRSHRQSIILEDLDTTNGTRVNGMRIKGAVRIEPGDIIDIGGTSFIVER